MLALLLDFALAADPAPGGEPPGDPAPAEEPPPAGEPGPVPAPAEAPAPAEDPPPAEEPPPVEEPAPGDGSIDASEAELRFRVPERWEYDPFFRPDGGVSLYSGGGYLASAISLGLVGGVRYWDQESRLHGQTRAEAMGLVLSGGFGSDLRVGSFMGPADKYWSIQAGPDLFRNGFRASGFVMEPSVGMDFVLRGTLGPQEAFLIAGVTPAILLNPDRRVDWDEVPYLGFGHEFEWQLGAVLDWGPLNFGAIYSRRITAVGVQQGLGFSLGL